MSKFDGFKLKFKRNKNWLKYSDALKVDIKISLDLNQSVCVCVVCPERGKIRMKHFVLHSHKKIFESRLF